MPLPVESSPPITTPHPHHFTPLSKDHVETLLNMLRPLLQPMVAVFTVILAFILGRSLVKNESTTVQEGKDAAAAAAKAQDEELFGSESD